MDGIWTRPSGVVIAFPDSALRPIRPEPDPSEPRGQLLLFTGIRYERPGRSDVPPALSGGPGRRRRP